MRWSFAMRHAIEDMPRDLVTTLRRYQLHQFRDGSFELRLQAVERPPEAFFERLMAAWEAVPAETPLMRIVEKDIEKPPGGKFETFTSDFVQSPLS
jgi:hypothetical protein